MVKKNKNINPFLDWSFKYLFGREETKDLLQQFLNLLLRPQPEITSLRYLPTEVIADSPDEKRCVFDVLCTDADGDHYLVEMQIAPQGNIRNRLVYYACRLIDSMGRHDSSWNYDIKRVYAICLMDFTYQEDPVLRNDILLRDARDGRVFSDRLNIITLQIPCIRAKNLADCQDSYEKMLFLLKQIRDGMKTNEELIAEINATTLPEYIKESFRKLVNTAREELLTPEERRAYDVEWKKYRDTMGQLEYARFEGHEQGLTEGEAKGRAEGKAEGREEGREEGLAEGEAKGRAEAMRAMSVSGITTDQIAKIMGIDKTVVEQILAE